MGRALVLAHGAFHGPWCWQALIERLEARDVVCSAVDLDRGGLEADRDALQQEISRLRGEGHRVSALGHSLGCASVAALDPGDLASVGFLAGSVLGPGMPDISKSVSSELLDHLEPQPDGRMRVPEQRARAAFYHRCAEEDARWALDRLRPTFIYGSQAAETPIWQRIPATYLVCEQDRAVFPDFQRQTAAVLPFSESLDSDHSPMLCMPDRLAECVMRLLERGD